MHKFYRFFGLALTIAWATGAAAAPLSLHYHTRTNIAPNDLQRVASLAEAVGDLSQKLAYHLYSITGPCNLLVDCHTATTYAVQLGAAARKLAKDARAATFSQAAPNGTFDVAFAALRSTDFDAVARAQSQFHDILPQAGGSGSGLADLACVDVLDVYWVLMNQVVDFPRPLGEGEGRGSDNI